MKFPQAAREVPGSVVEEPRRSAGFGTARRAARGLRLPSRRLRNTLITAVMPVAVVAIGWTVFSPSTGGDASTAAGISPREAVEPAGDGGSRPTEASEDSPAQKAPELSAALGRRSYALAIPELEGFPPDAAPGTRLELWVAWEPPITESPQMQVLLKNVVVERIVTPITPEQPATVIVSVPERRVADLLYGDRWGALGVTIPPQNP